MSVTQDKRGGRVIELYIPFEVSGKKIDTVTLAPFEYGHVVRWQQGYYKGQSALLGELSGLDEVVLYKIRYPDIDRVLMAFFEMMPAEIRDNMLNGRVPQRVAAPAPEPAPEQAGGHVGDDGADAGGFDIEDQ